MSYPKHGVQIYGPGISELDAAKKAAELGSNVLRMRLNWHEIEPQKGNWDPGAILTRYRNICHQARNWMNRPQIKLLPVFDNLPAWVNGVQTLTFPGANPGDPPKHRRHFAASEAGCEEFGIAVGRVMKELGDYADLIEISNEPNIKVTGPGDASAGIPTAWYGRMAAYAMIWIDACTNSDPAKGILMGAIDCLTGAINYTQQNPHPKWVFDAPEFYASKITDAFNIWLYLLTGSIDLSGRARISCHPYPRMFTEQPGSQAAQQVWQRFEKIRAAVNPNRMLWITEVGASSYWLRPGIQTVGVQGNGFARQVGFVDHLMDGSALRHNTQNLEGVIMWPLNDHAQLDGTTANPSQFKDTGLYYKNLNIKPAGTALTNRWGAWN